MKPSQSENPSGAAIGRGPHETQSPTESEGSHTNNWFLLVDGTALFFGQRKISPDKNMNYLVLRDAIQRESGAATGPRGAFFFTASDEGNPNQVKFHDMIRSAVGWHVHPIPPHDATTANPLLDQPASMSIRFDAMIAYALGRLTASGASSTPIQSGSQQAGGRLRVLVLSDSWPLAGPIKDCVARGAAVTVVFFGSLIDNRWHKVFRDAERSESGLDFFDLDVIAPRLFDRTRIAKKVHDDLLPNLP
jgi:hypothetical protein